MCRVLRRRGQEGHGLHGRRPTGELPVPVDDGAGVWFCNIICDCMCRCADVWCHGMWVGECVLPTPGSAVSSLLAPSLTHARAEAQPGQAPGARRFLTDLWQWPSPPTGELPTGELRRPGPIRPLPPRLCLPSAHPPLPTGELPAATRPAWVGAVRLPSGPLRPPPSLPQPRPPPQSHGPVCQRVEPHPTS